MTFLLNVFTPNAFINQNSYLHNSFKPFHLNCQQLAAHLCLTSQYISLLAGIPTPNTAPHEDEDLDIIFFSMMLQDWKGNFDKFGKIISSPNS